MRHHWTTVSAALIAGSLAVATAHADPGPGWVDPPAKGASGKDMSTKDPATKESGPGDSVARGNEPPKLEARPQTAEMPSGQAATPAGTNNNIAQTPAAKPALATARTGSGKPSRPREAHRSIRKSPTPLAFAPATGAKGNDPRFVEWAGRAQRLTTDYLDSVSSPNAVTLAEAARFYAPQVRRFGRMETLASVLADKRRFAKRWPERRYAAQADAIRTACNAEQKACIVRTTFDYQAGSAARGARAQGVAELVLTISFADGRPVIVSESSRVLRRGASATLVDTAAKRGA